MPSFFKAVIIASFIILMVLWVVRIVMTFCTQGKAGEAGETLGATRGAVRTFLLLVFAAFTFWALTTPEIFSPSDKKWILTTFGSVVTFYFASKIITERRSSK